MNTVEKQIVVHNMKVILIRSRGNDPAIQKYANSLAHEGYDVTLLVWDRKNQIPIGNSTSFTTHCFKFNAPYDTISVFFYYPVWMMYEFIFLMKSDADIIHACDLDTLYPAIIVKIMRNKRFVYLIFDLYANHLLYGKFLMIRTVIRSIVAHIEKIGIGFADLLILVDESRMEEVKGAKIKKVIYVYNTPEEVSIQKEYNLVKMSDNSIVIFYAGIIHKDRGIWDMITAVKDLDDVELILAGPESNKKTILDEINEKIRHIGWIPTYEEIIAITNKVDILFRLSDPKDPVTKHASPNKLFEAMMCGKPIIVSDDSSMATIVRQNNCGLVVPYGDVSAIKEAIIKLKNNPSLKEELGKNGRKAYEQKYSWKIMDKRLVKAYEDLII
jgi:glycosyltransferase involved in cell wall biosynthesis